MATFVAEVVCDEWKRRHDCYRDRNDGGQVGLRLVEREAQNENGDSSVLDASLDRDR